MENVLGVANCEVPGEVVKTVCNEREEMKEAEKYMSRKHTVSKSPLLQNHAIVSVILSCFSDQNCIKVKLLFDFMNDLTDVLTLDVIFPKAVDVGWWGV